MFNDCRAAFHPPHSWDFICILFLTPYTCYEPKYQEKCENVLGNKQDSDSVVTEHLVNK